MISIICPVYNTGTFLIECVNSVIVQDMIDWELLLIDDGSTDKSPEICDNFAEKDSRIKVFHKQNEGQWLTREFGINRAKGQYFIFLDSDDMLEPHALRKLSTYIQKYNSDVYLYDISRLNPDSTKTCLQELYEEKHFNETKQIIDFCFVKNNCISLCVYCFKKTFYANCLIETNQNKSIRSQEDFLMLFNLIQQLSSLIVIPEVLYIYRSNSNSTSNNLGINDYYKNVLISSEIYQTIFNKFNSNLSTYSSKIKNRLAWQPISFIKRAYNYLPQVERKRYFSKIKKSFIYLKFTKKLRFKARKDRLILLFFRMNLHKINEYLVRKKW